jgi:hypothetical protein
VKGGTKAIKAIKICLFSGRSGVSVGRGLPSLGLLSDEGVISKDTSALISLINPEYVAIPSLCSDVYMVACHAAELFFSQIVQFL